MNRFMRRCCCALLAGVLLSACATRTEGPTIQGGLVVAAMGETVLQHYRDARPKRFLRVDHVVFRMGGQVRSFIGYTRIDLRAGRFSVAAVTALGIRLFILSGDRDSVVIHTLSPAFSRENAAAEAVAADIRRVHFDPPATDPEAVSIENGIYRFDIPDDDGSLTVMRIDPEGNRLVEKEVQDGQRRCAVHYGGYSGAYAGEIRFEDRTRGYTLTFHLKRIGSSDGGLAQPGPGGG